MQRNILVVAPIQYFGFTTYKETKKCGNLLDNEKGEIESCSNTKADKSSALSKIKINDLHTNGVEFAGMERKKKRNFCRGRKEKSIQDVKYSSFRL